MEVQSKFMRTHIKLHGVFTDSKSACAPNEFLCRNGKYIIARCAVCDGQNNCGDNSDEENCEARQKSWSRVPTRPKGRQL